MSCTAATHVVILRMSTTDPTALGIPIQKTIAGIDSNLPVSDILTMQQVLGKSIANSSFEASLLGAFAALSLLLAAVGLFGVLSYLVAQRTGEIGIRIALGAQREQVLRLMLVDGLRPAVIGLAIGLSLSAVVTREIQSLLYGTRPLDPTRIWSCQPCAAVGRRSRLRFSSVASFTAGSDAGASDRIAPRRHSAWRVSHVGHSSHV